MTVGIGRRIALLTILAGLAMLASPLPAHAAFTLTLHQTGFTDVTVTDNGAGDTSNTTSGLITFSGMFGTFTIQADIASSNSASGTQPAVLTINQLSIAGTSAATASNPLVITVQDTLFTAPPPGPGVMSSQLSLTALTPAGGVTFQSFLNGTGGTLLSLSTAPSGTSASNAVTISTQPYTLANVTTVTLAANGLIQSTGTTAVVLPEPGTLAMTLAALPVLGFSFWRRRAKA